MTVKYSAAEVLRIAQQMEENGRRFYLESARAAGRGPLALFFNTLAEDEARHLDTYREMARRACADTCSCGGGEEADSFLGALAQSVLFAPGTGGKKRIFDLETALLHAIQGEKDAVLFYLELMRFVGEEERGAVEKIVEEEKRHLRLLDAELTKARE